MHGLQQRKMVLGCERGPFAALALVCVFLVIGFHTRNSIAAAIVFFPLGFLYLWISARRPKATPVSKPRRRNSKRRTSTDDRGDPYGIHEDGGDPYSIRDDLMRPVAVPSVHVYDPGAGLYPPMPH